MSIKTTLSTEKQNTVLQDLCARNQSADLCHEPDKGQPINAKVRFLELEEETLIVDYPSSTSCPIALRPGDLIQMYFQHSKRWLTFRSNIIERCLWSQGPRRPQIKVLRLRYPKRVYRSQRRRAYRISMLHFPDSYVRFWNLGDDWTEEPLFVATSHNLSETGSGILVDMKTARAIQVKQEYFAEFTIPTDGLEIRTACVVRHKQMIGKTEHLLVGVEWLWDEDDSETRPIRDKLGKFVMAEQLEALRRQKQHEE